MSLFGARRRQDEFARSMRFADVVLSADWRAAVTLITWHLFKNATAALSGHLAWHVVGGTPLGGYTTNRLDNAFYW